MSEETVILTSNLSVEAAWDRAAKHLGGEPDYMEQGVDLLGSKYYNITKGEHTLKLYIPSAILTDKPESATEPAWLAELDAETAVERVKEKKREAKKNMFTKHESSAPIPLDPITPPKRRFTFEKDK